MSRLIKWRALVTLFAAATIVHAWRNEQSHGTFVGVPYDFRMPTPRRIKERLWNPDDSRIFTPRSFGIGWSVNLYQVWKRLRTGDDPMGKSPESQG